MRTRTAVLLTALATILGVAPAPASADDAAPLVWASGGFLDADRALIGCVRPTGWRTATAPVPEWCFVAHDLDDGEGVRVVVRVDTWQPSITPRTHQPVILDDVLPAAALSWTGGTLRLTGAMSDGPLSFDVAGVASSTFTRDAQYGACSPENAVDAELASTGAEPTVTLPARFSGTVDGQQVELVSGLCTYLVRGATAGLWSMNNAVF